jgi:aspartate kinase
MIVLKFGGTSLESAEAIERMEAIVRSRLARRPVLVVSALGKVTDNLLALGTEAAAGRRQQALERYVWLREYHSRIADALIRSQDRQQVEDFLEKHFSELQAVLDALPEGGEFTPRAQDAVTSFGERLSSGIVTLALRKCGIATSHLDSLQLIRTNNHHTQALPLLKETYANARRAIGSLEPGVVPVLGGFIGTTSEGVITTLGRNSSNLTAVLIAASLNAEVVEMWTDVDGVFPHDPRRVSDQYPLEEMSFDDALELAYSGARVLHPGAVRLARETGIPLWIKNSRRPELHGTRIAAGVPLVRAERVAYLEQGTAASD